MLIRVSMDMLYCFGVVGVVLQIQKYSCCLCGGWIQNAEIQKHSSCLCAILARFKSEWGLERNQFLGCVLNSSVRLEIGSGQSGNGMRCLEPGQKFSLRPSGAV